MALTKWLYYVVDHAWMACIDAAGTRAQLFELDGSWSAMEDVWKVCVDGRQVKSESEASQEGGEIFESRGNASLYRLLTSQKFHD